MREDCRHFQSRTYDDGEVARLCTLNLAPEAPWRCPENCPEYRRDVLTVGFTSGSLTRPPVEAEPDDPPGDIAGLLEQADDIVNSAGPAIVAEFEAERRSKRWWQFWKKGDDGGNEHRMSNR